MKNQKRSTAIIITMVGLGLFALSVAWQKIMGVTNYPPIPPAIVLGIIAILLLWFKGQKLWAAIVAYLIPLSLFIGMIINGWYTKLVEPSATGYPGIVLQWAAVIVVIISGAIVIAEASRSRRK